jgi:hypothetical protein
MMRALGSPIRLAITLRTATAAVLFTLGLVAACGGKQVGPPDSGSGGSAGTGGSGGSGGTGGAGGSGGTGGGSQCNGHCEMGDSSSPPRTVDIPGVGQVTIGTTPCDGDVYASDPDSAGYVICVDGIWQYSNAIPSGYTQIVTDDAGG